MTNEAAGPAPAACPLCSSPAPRLERYRLKDFRILLCEACGGLQRDPLPTAAELEAYYRDPAYIDGGYFAQGDGAAAARAARESPEVAIYTEALDFLQARRAGAGLAGSGRLLDVGAGSGGFLALAAGRGWLADGVELSPELAARARERTGCDVAEGDFLAARPAAEAYDAITMWDLLEHTLDPAAVLDRAAALLAPAGVLVVFTIDSDSLFNVVADLGWRASGGRLTAPLELLYDKRHNHYFSGRSLGALLRRRGLRVEALATHRAHLGRWMSEPAGPMMLAGAELIDWLSVPLGRPYRQLLYCVRER